MMWIAKNNDLIVLVRDSKKELLKDLQLMQYTSVEETTKEYILYNGEYITKEEIITQREQQFKKEFFRTSLGWIRRKVTKADGNKADFLLDYVPAIKTALEMGLSYNIITYDKPDFNEDVIDWTQYQHFKPANTTFIQECLQQIANDFLPQS